MTLIPGTARLAAPDTLNVVDRDGREHEVREATIHLHSR